MNNNKINVLYTEFAPGFGGAAVSLCSQIERLDRKRYNPVIITSHDDAATISIIAKLNVKFIYVGLYKRKERVNKILIKLSNFGIIIKNFVLFWILLIEEIFRLFSAIKIKKALSRENIHIVHLNNAIDSEGITISKLLKAPCICHLRGFPYNSIIKRFLARYVTYFIAVSEYVKEGMLKLGVSSDKIRVIYDGIDVQKCLEKSNFSNKEAFEKNKFGKYNIGIFSCLMGWKGHKIFIKAAEILLKKRNLKEYKFFIIGDVPNKESMLREELMNLVNVLGIAENVIFAGYQDNVFQFIKKMDIVIHASTEPEPFGRVIIEAMALEKPVIATKMGGPLEIIEDRINGILIEANNPNILADAIFTLSKDREERARIGKAAAKTIRQRYSFNNYKEVEELYEMSLSLEE